VFLDRSFLPWNDIAADRDLPKAVTLAMKIDPGELGLQEMRCGIGTVTAPPDYLSAIESGAVFIRNVEETVEPLPLSELEVADIDELPDLTARANEGVSEWYAHVAELPRRRKIMNGALVYYVGMVYPLLQAVGAADYFEDELDLWEMHPIISEAYYDCMGQMAQEFVPTQIMFGYGWSEVPEEPDAASPYADYLAEASESGWHSDLSGMLEVPDHWAGKMNDGVLDVPLTKTDTGIDRTELGDHLESL
jgi:hypothetical protein